MIGWVEGGGLFSLGSSILQPTKVSSIFGTPTVVNSEVLALGVNLSSEEHEMFVCGLEVAVSILHLTLRFCGGFVQGECL